MPRQILRTAVATAISFALLYYSVAWAVLRCPHQENHSDEIALSDPGSYGAEIAPLSSDPHQANFDCTGPGYHTESLAGPIAPSELLRLIRDVAPEANALLPLANLAQDQAGDLWLMALLDKGSVPMFPFDMPRYLSLSVLRI